MPTTINPDATSLFPNSLVGPADGDLANAASVNGAFQTLVDGTQAAKLALFGRATNKPNYFISDDGGGGFPKMTIYPMGQIVLTTGGGADWGVLQHNVTTVLDLRTAYGGTIPTKTRLYVYAFNSGGSIAFTATASPPDVYVRYGASTDFYYVGTVLSDPSNTNRVFVEYEIGGFHLFQASAGLFQELIPGIGVLNNGVATSFTAVDVDNPAAFGQLVPAYAQIVRLAALMNASAAADFMRIESIIGAARITASASGATAVHTFDMPLDAGNIFYNVSTASASGFIVLAGWYDPR